MKKLLFIFIFSFRLFAGCVGYDLQSSVYDNGKLYTINPSCLSQLSSNFSSLGSICAVVNGLDYYEIKGGVPSSALQECNLSICKTYDSDINACVDSKGNIKCLGSNMVFNPNIEKCISKDSFNQQCYKKCSGFISQLDASTFTCICQTCQQIFSNLLKKCSLGLKNGLNCSYSGGSLYVNFSPFSDVCLNNDKNSSDKNSSIGTLSFCYSDPDTNQSYCFDGEPSSDNNLCVTDAKTGNTVCSVLGSDNNKSLCITDSDTGKTKCYQLSGSGSDDNLTSNLNNSKLDNNYSSNSESKSNSNLNFNLLSDISSKISNTNSKLSDIDTNIKTLINLKPDSQPSSSLDSDTESFLSGFSDTIKNIKSSVSDLKSSVSKLKDFLKNPKKLTLFSNSDVQTCPVSFTVYKKNITFNICKMVSPYRPIIQLVFTLLFSISVLLYFFDVFIRSK